MIFNNISFQLRFFQIGKNILSWDKTSQNLLVIYFLPIKLCNCSINLVVDLCKYEPKKAQNTIKGLTANF